MKTQSYVFFSDVTCVSEKSYPFFNKKYDQTRIQYILYRNYVFKTTYQILPNMKISVFSIFKFKI